MLQLLYYYIILTVIIILYYIIQLLYSYYINSSIHITVKICDDNCSQNKRCERINQTRKKTNNTLRNFRENFDTFDINLICPF